MNLSSRLTFALVTVVIVVVFGHVAYSVYLEYRSTRTEAGICLSDPKDKEGRCAKLKLLGSLQNTQTFTDLVARKLLKDNKVKTGLDDRDKNLLAQAAKETAEREVFAGSIWLLDEKGNVLFNSDTPQKSGYSLKQDSQGLDQAISTRQAFHGTLSNNQTGMVSVSTILPAPHGFIVVNQPISQEYLSAIATRIGIENPRAQGVELAIYSRRQSKTVAWSQDFPQQKCFRFLQEINLKGLPQGYPEKPFAAITGIGFIDQLLVPVPGFERADGWWIDFRTLDKSREFNAIIFLAKPVPSMTNKAIEVVLLGGLVGVLGVLVGIFLATRIAASVNEPMKFLIKRTRAIANNKQVIPPLEDLTGDWYDLGELIDTAVLSMRSTTQNLKTQLTKQMKQVEERNQLAEQSTQQVDVLNNQITHQAKQIAEYSRQINQANRQAIMVQQQLDAVLQASTEGYLITDQFGNILHANPIVLNWLGTTEGEIAGRLCFDLVRKPGEPSHMESPGQAFAQHGGNANALIEQFYPEGVVHSKDGTKKIEVLAHLQPLSGDDGSIQGYIMVLRDKSLRSENQLLRQEIVTMLQENIRAPLAAGEMGWSAILSNADNTMHPSVSKSLADLHLNYEQMIGLVDSLLMMYGGFVPQPVVPKEQIAITRLVADALDEVTPLARERQLTLDYKTVTGLPLISGNKEAIMGILRQVLERMIVITAAGGRVRIESQLRGNEMRIGISSSGPALPEFEIQDMFLGFIEGKHALETYGSRLSMQLARTNVERMGGRIWAQSEAGRGTVTYFTLPTN